MSALQWGRKPPPGLEVEAAFGARAILTRTGTPGVCSVDWVWDRMGVDRPLPDIPADFTAWVEKVGSPWVETLAAQGKITFDGGEVLILDEGVFHAEASAQRSYGYVYVGMWKRREAAA